MPAYLFEMELPEFDEQILETIPAHRFHVNVLFEKGILISYSVSMSRTKLWCIVNADTELRGMDIISSLPLYPFFTQVQCSELLFHNAASTTLPGIVLN